MSNNRWARIAEDGVTLVEFTFENPEGRFHPDIVWIPVGPDVKYGSRLTTLGQIEEPIPTQEIKGTQPEEVGLDMSEEAKSLRNLSEKMAEAEALKLTATIEQ